MCYNYQQRFYVYGLWDFRLSVLNKQVIAYKRKGGVNMYQGQRYT